jgi:hypothetical protein
MRAHFVCSLFWNLKFYQTSHLKIEIANFCAQKTNFVPSFANGWKFQSIKHYNQDNPASSFLLKVTLKENFGFRLMLFLIERLKKKNFNETFNLFFTSLFGMPILHKPDFDLFCTILLKNQKGPQRDDKSTISIYRPFVGISREVISFFWSTIKLLFMIKVIII